MIQYKQGKNMDDFQPIRYPIKAQLYDVSNRLNQLIKLYNEIISTNDSSLLIPLLNKLNDMIMDMLAHEMVLIYENNQLHDVINRQKATIHKEENCYKETLSELENEKVFFDIIYNTYKIFDKVINIEDIEIQVLKLIGETFKFNIGEIWLLDEEDNKLHCKRQWYSNNFMSFLESKMTNEQIQIDTNFVNRVYDKNKPIWVSSLTKYMEVMLQTSIGIPIHYKNKKLGILNFFSEKQIPKNIKVLNTLAVISARLGKLFQYELAKHTIEYNLSHDSLTGLLNRPRLEHFLNKMITANKNIPLAIITIDIDKLKSINASMGYYVGDQVIQVIADRLKKLVENDNNLLSRIGADKFAFVLKESKDKNYIINYVKHLLSILNNPIHINNQKMVIATSVGISMYPDDGCDSTTLLKNSDAALSLVKEQGGHHFQFFQPDIPLHVYEKFTLTNDLRDAVVKHQLILYYQPKIDLKTNTICGVEALLRWQHPEKGLLNPSAFINIAEETGLIIPIGEWVLHEIFELLATKKVKVPIAVNLSIIQLSKQYDLVSYISHLMDEFDVPGNKLEYEITENILMLAEQNSIRVLNQLKHFGSKISFDDFGSGYSSFSYLKYFIPTSVKIDKSFIDPLTKNASTALQIVKAMIMLSHTLNVKVIAEGVTSHQQIQMLKKYGCDQVQGYYFSKALPLEELIIFIQDNT
jgi:diguanylate cyclase (GGDEF)-like protein